MIDDQKTISNESSAHEWMADRPPRETAPHLSTRCDDCLAPMANCQAPQPDLPKNADSNDSAFSVCQQCGSVLELFSEFQSTIDLSVSQAPDLRDRFRVGPVIGSGSFGVVYQAFDIDLKRNVAIKAAQKKLAGFETAVFLREARIASRLRHPNIVTIHDLRKNPDGVFIISDFIDGQTMRLWMEKRNLPLTDCLRLLIKLCRAMDYAHRNGVVHRDLKPGNIMIDVAGEPHILDFGLSQSIDASTETVSRLGSPLGTPAFMAPEQVLGDRSKIDQRSDIYAFGVMLYQILAERLPFIGIKESLYYDIVNTPPPSVRTFAPKVPRSLEAVCLKALQKDPKDRYQQAGQMADELQRYLDGKIVKAFGKPDLRSAWHLARSQFMVATVVLLMLLTGTLFYFSYTRYLQDHPGLAFIQDVKPNGARLVWEPLDTQHDGRHQVTEIPGEAGTEIWLEPGFYRVRLMAEDNLQEFYRTVPATSDEISRLTRSFQNQSVNIHHRSSLVEAGKCRFPSVDIVPVRDLKDMAFIPGGHVTLPASTGVVADLSGVSAHVGSFLISQREVTWGQLQAVWPDLEIPENESPNDSAHGIPWDLAATFAEQNGCALPTVFQLHLAATNGGTTQVPSGDWDPQWQTQAPEWALPKIAFWDVTKNTPPVQGLLTGYEEWTSTPSRLFYYLPDGEGQTAQRLPLSATNMEIATGPLSICWKVIARPMGNTTPIPSIQNSAFSGSAKHDIKNTGFRLVRTLAN